MFRDALRVAKVLVESGDRVAAGLERRQSIAHHLASQLAEFLAFVGVRLQNRLGMFQLDLDHALGRSTRGQPLGGGEIFLHPALNEGQHFSTDGLQAANPGLARPDHRIEIVAHQSGRIGATLSHLVLDVMNRRAVLGHVIYPVMRWIGDPARRVRGNAVNRQFCCIAT